LLLSLTKDGLPELLTPEAVATYRVPGTLVVLSGCSSEQGKALASAGLMGLSRAWLLAGAAAVIVTAWPTPDDSGHFFSVFYSRFQALEGGSVGHRAARALQAAQLEMERSGGYRSSSSYWGAYSIVSKE
jgi:CHAT domain-containing protein